MQRNMKYLENLEIVIMGGIVPRSGILLRCGPCYIVDPATLWILLSYPPPCPQGTEWSDCRVFKCPRAVRLDDLKGTAAPTVTNTCRHLHDFFWTFFSVDIWIAFFGHFAPKMVPKRSQNYAKNAPKCRPKGRPRNDAPKSQIWGLYLPVSANAHVLDS